MAEPISLKPAIQITSNTQVPSKDLYFVSCTYPMLNDIGNLAGIAHFIEISLVLCTQAQFRHAFQASNTSPCAAPNSTKLFIRL